MEILLERAQLEVNASDEEHPEHQEPEYLESASSPYPYGRRKKEYDGFLKQVKQLREMVDGCFANGETLQDNDVREIYKVIRSSTLRIVRMFYNRRVLILSTERTDGGGEKWDYRLDLDDRRSQAEFFSRWNHKERLRVPLGAGKVFDLLCESIFSVKCFGTGPDAERGLEQFELALERSVVLPSECRRWRTQTVRCARFQTARYSRAHKASQRIMAYMKPVRYLTESKENVFNFASEVEEETQLLCEVALGLSLALRASSFEYEFRVIDQGTPITSRTSSEFTINAFMEEEQPEHIESCEVASTVFRALLRSQESGPRPALLLDKATVMGYQGPQVRLDLEAQKNPPLLESRDEEDFM